MGPLTKLKAGHLSTSDLRVPSMCVNHVSNVLIIILAVHMSQTQLGPSTGPKACQLSATEVRWLVCVTCA